MEVRSSRGTKSVKEGRAAEGPVQPNMGRERGGGGRRERESRGTDWVEKRIYTQYVLQGHLYEGIFCYSYNTVLET